jgi:DNA-binding CsgD family transcriptional regulator
VALSKRKSEILLFDQVFAASAHGKGAVLLVSGPVGTGKTALLQEMAARAGRQGGLCFLVTASAGERARPFGVLDRLIQSMGAAGMKEPLPHGGLDNGSDFFATMDQVCAAIRDFDGGRPAVIGIDDVHFADEHSLRCLAYLIRRIERFGLIMILNESTSYERDTADLRAEMLHLPYCHWARLEPLTPADIAEQVTERFGGPPDGAFVRFCAEAGGGNPLLLHALIDDRIAAQGAEPGQPGACFRQAVLRILHRCAPATAAVAQFMAVLGDYATPALIAELGAADLTLVREGMRDLHETGLLGTDRFRDDHIRSAVLASIPLRSLPDLHSRAAELLHASGAPATTVAEHLITAQDGGKAAWRATILCEAGREAMAAGDVDSAVNTLRYAVGSSADEAQRAQAAVLAAEAQWHADPSRAARRLHDLGRDARAGLLTGPDILVVVNQLLWWGEFAEADELLRLCGAAAGGDSSLAQLWAFICRVGGGSGACPESGLPADAPFACSGPLAAATYLSSAATLAYDAMTTDRADQMLLGLRAGTPLTPALYALVVLVQTRRLDEAGAWCDRLLKEDWIARVPMRRAMIGTIRAVAALRGGDSETALGGIREVLDVVPPPAWGVVAGLPLSVAVRATTELGDTSSARSYLAVPVPAAMFDTPFALPYLRAIGGYNQAMGHAQSALTHFRSCVELMTKWSVGIDEPGPDEDAPFPGGRRRDPEPAGPPPSGTTDTARLTDAEQRVATLAAAGNTNRQIAEHLFITVSTVEQHLTKIYRKLNVRSRSGLRRYRH